MSHRSRLSLATARNELACIICGCTQENPCRLIIEGADGEDGEITTCEWISPGLCSNPECGKEFERRFGQDVPQVVDSRYLQLDDFAARRAEDFLPYGEEDPSEDDVDDELQEIA